MTVTAEELLDAAAHCLLCGQHHPERTGHDHRGLSFTTDRTDHARLPLDPLTMLRMRALLPVTAGDRPRVVRTRARKGGDGK